MVASKQVLAFVGAAAVLPAIFLQGCEEDKTGSGSNQNGGSSSDPHAKLVSEMVEDLKNDPLLKSAIESGKITELAKEWANNFIGVAPKSMEEDGLFSRFEYEKRTVAVAVHDPSQAAVVQMANELVLEYGHVTESSTDAQIQNKKEKSAKLVAPWQYLNDMEVRRAKAANEDPKLVKNPAVQFLKGMAKIFFDFEHPNNSYLVNFNSYARDNQVCAEKPKVEHSVKEIEWLAFTFFRAVHDLDVYKTVKQKADEATKKQQQQQQPAKEGTIAPQPVEKHEFVGSSLSYFKPQFFPWQNNMNLAVGLLVLSDAQAKSEAKNYEAVSLAMVQMFRDINAEALWRINYREQDEKDEQMKDKMHVTVPAAGEVKTVDALVKHKDSEYDAAQDGIERFAVVNFWGRCQDDFTLADVSNFEDGEVPRFRTLSEDDSMVGFRKYVKLADEQLDKLKTMFEDMKENGADDGEEWAKETFGEAVAETLAHKGKLNQDAIAQHPFIQYGFFTSLPVVHDQYTAAKGLVSASDVKYPDDGVADDRVQRFFGANGDERAKQQVKSAEPTLYSMLWGLVTAAQQMPNSKEYGIPEGEFPHCVTEGKYMRDHEWTTAQAHHAGEVSDLVEKLAKEKGNQEFLKNAMGNKYDAIMFEMLFAFVPTFAMQLELVQSSFVLAVGLQKDGDEDVFNQRRFPEKMSFLRFVPFMHQGDRAESKTASKFTSQNQHEKHFASTAMFNNLSQFFTKKLPSAFGAVFGTNNPEHPAQNQVYPDATTFPKYGRKADAIKWFHEHFDFEKQEFPAADAKTRTASKRTPTGIVKPLFDHVAGVTMDKKPRWTADAEELIAEREKFMWEFDFTIAGWDKWSSTLFNKVRFVQPRLATDESAVDVAWRVIKPYFTVFVHSQTARLGDSLDISLAEHQRYEQKWTPDMEANDDYDATEAGKKATWIAELERLTREVATKVGAELVAAKRALADHKATQARAYDHKKADPERQKKDKDGNLVWVKEEDRFDVRVAKVPTKFAAEASKLYLEYVKATKESDDTIKIAVDKFKEAVQKIPSSSGVRGA